MPAPAHPAPALTKLAATTQAQPAPIRPWAVTPQRAFTWASAPYLPVGLRVEGTPAAIQAGLDAGVTDFIVDLPLDGSGWKAAIETLESGGARYVVSIATAAPAAEVAAIEPESYRLPGLTGVVDQTIALPGVTRARVLVASEDTGNTVYEATVRAVDSQIRVQVPGTLRGLHVLVVYPIQRDLTTPDYWEGFDVFRDRLLATLRDNPLGPGARAILNPFGTSLRAFTASDTFVPTSRMFQLELETFLTQKYGTADNVGNAWGLGLSDMPTIADLSRAIPLWSDSRGVPQVWNPVRDTTALAERTGRMWSDIREVVTAGANRRYNRLVESVKAATGLPVIQDWTGWGGPYQNRETPLDAVGFSARIRTFGDTMDAPSRPLSSAFRRSAPTAAWATEIRLEPAEGENLTPESVVNLTANMGVRGWFFRAQTPSEIQAVAQAARLRDNPDTAAFIPQPLFFPESARDPAAPTRLPGGHVWLPGPGSGERLDLGPGLEGYRYLDGPRSILAFWSVNLPQPQQFRVASDTIPDYRAIDGSDLGMAVRRKLLTATIPQSPVVSSSVEDVPASVAAFDQAADGVAYMISEFGMIADLAGAEPVRLRQWLDGFLRTPGASLVGIRRQYRDLLLRTSPYLWIEGESTITPVFGANRRLPGASNDQTFNLSPRILPPNGSRARYRVRPRVDGAHRVWIAARIPENARSGIKLDFGGQTLELSPSPVSHYGDGLAWYSCGEVNLSTGETQFELRLDRIVSTPVAIDVILFTPFEFRPRGPQPPDDWLLTAMRNTPPSLRSLLAPPQLPRPRPGQHAESTSR